MPQTIRLHEAGHLEAVFEPLVVGVLDQHVEALGLAVEAQARVHGAARRDASLAEERVGEALVQVGGVAVGRVDVRAVSVFRILITRFGGRLLPIPRQGRNRENQVNENCVIRSGNSLTRVSSQTQAKSPRQ